MRKEFVGLSKNKAVRKAVSFWYKELHDIMTLKEFISKCTWKKCGQEHIVIFRG